MIARNEVNHADQPVRRIDPGFRLARLAKSGTGIGLDHRVRIRRNCYLYNRLGRLYSILTRTVSVAPCISSPATARAAFQLASFLQTDVGESGFFTKPMLKNSRFYCPNGPIAQLDRVADFYS